MEGFLAFLCSYKPQQQKTQKKGKTKNKYDEKINKNYKDRECDENQQMQYNAINNNNKHQ